jgi:hypothetical protein
MAFELENKNKAYEDSDVYVDNDDILYVRVNSYDAVKYFAPDFIVKDYGKYRLGNLYFIYDKTETTSNRPKIYTIYDKNNDGKLLILDEFGRTKTYSDLIEEFPSISDNITNNLGVGNTYSTLLAISKGEYTESFNRKVIKINDDLASYIRYNETNPHKSVVFLQFEDSESYFKLFEYDDDEISYMERIVNDRRYYSNFSFEDPSYTYESFNEGYLLYDFNEENKQKLKKIRDVISPGADIFNNTDEGEKFCKLLDGMFDREVSRIVDEYHELMEKCKIESEQQNIKNELCDVLNEYGIIQRQCFSEYITTINILLSLYKQTKRFDLDIHGLLSEFGHKISVTEFYEYYYETQCDFFDDFSENFNRGVSGYLDDIIEKIEDENLFGNKELFNKYHKYVFGPYKTHKWYNVPHNKKNQFMILQADVKEDRILIAYEVSEPFKREQRSYNLEGFLNFLHNPELFEGKIRKIKKI